MVDLRIRRRAFLAVRGAFFKQQIVYCQKFVYAFKQIHSQFSTFRTRSGKIASVHIVISPDKFKGSLTGAQAACCIRDGFSRVFPEATFELLPLADGGEGILDAFRDALTGAMRETTVRDAYGREVSASWLMTGTSAKTAIIESSQANGLWRVSPDERDLSRASNYGVGQLILAAASEGAEKIIIGIGGSATNDAGLGMAAALGYRFLASDGTEIDPIPANLRSIHSISPPQKLALPPITVACDVENPLLGPRGATRVYGPQKGLRPQQAESAEAAHAHLAEIAERHFKTSFADVPGAGAAGGLGFGLMTFCNASLESGFDCIAGILGAEQAISKASIVITGEGSLDHQTMEGKTPYGVSKLARKHNIPVYALAGRLADEEILHRHFDGIASIVNSPMTLDEAIADAPQLLEKAATRLAHTLKNSKL